MPFTHRQLANGASPSLQVSGIEPWLGRNISSKVCFAGVQSNFGGVYRPDGLANEALHWMIEKAEGQGLEFDQAFLSHYRPCFNSKLQDSMTVMYEDNGPYSTIR